MGMVGANMGGELIVALQLEVPHHFVKGIARGRVGGPEDPGACRATETLKTVCFDPYELSSCCHYSRKAKCRVRLFGTIFTLISFSPAASFNALRWPSA
jgi:hypothetical protein